MGVVAEGDTLVRADITLVINGHAYFARPSREASSSLDGKEMASASHRLAQALQPITQLKGFSNAGWLSSSFQRNTSCSQKL
jgi:hypothetical protein